MVRPVSDEPENYNVPTWKFFVALVVVLISVTLGTMLWMWSDSRPRRRPPMLGAPEPVKVQTNTVPPAAR